jgi:hypothetical protein
MTCHSIALILSLQSAIICDSAQFYLKLQGEQLDVADLADLLNALNLNIGKWRGGGLVQRLEDATIIGDRLIAKGVWIAELREVSRRNSV